MKFRRIAFVFTLWCSCNTAALAATYTWTGNATPPLNSLWSNVTNWAPSSVPGAGDTAIISSPGVNAIYINQPVTVANLTAIGATLMGSSSLTVNGTLEAQYATFGPAGGI